ncbi:MAG TPA: N-acetyl-gamma-glutamyl-phosphate reductase, partial [Phycisphaerales bacterium]|nr:N-acetyl-gamma-glutamyl-phosphate reductase [Phycisphaerales bacterium]
MNKNAIRVSVAGASGYTGGELLRYLLGHPHVEIKSVLANSQAGSKLTTLFPNLKGFLDLTLETADWEQLSQDNDLVFLCLPHGTSQEPVSILIKNGCKVVDLGADFRLQSPDLYESTYGAEHLFPELLEQAAYGLPELNRDKIKNANLVANPGCYPTASTLALLPILSKGPLAQPPIIDAKSGVSGAGRGAKVDSLYCEVNENFRAYAVGTHRHQPEIEQSVGQPVMFTPHLVPMTRGILATVYVGLPTDGLLEHYQEFYSREPFVEVLTDSLPSTKSV